MLKWNQMQFLVEEIDLMKTSDTCICLINEHFITDNTYETVFKLMESNPIVLINICNDLYQHYMDFDAIMGNDAFPDPNADWDKSNQAYKLMRIIENEIGRNIQNQREVNDYGKGNNGV